MIIKLAIATNTAPAQWRNESDVVLATAIDVLDRAAKRAKERGRG